MFIPAAADETQEDDHYTKTAAALQLMDEMEREMEAYCTTTPVEKAVVQEYMEEDEAMRARFEEWMKEYGRTYKDEVETGFTLPVGNRRLPPNFPDTAARR